MKLEMPCKKSWRALDTHGYPKITVNGKTMTLARHLYMDYHKVELTSDEVVMHLCDNIWCVEISHLQVGSQQDNLKDMVAKGRHSKGSGRWNHVLKEEDIPKIRTLYAEGNWTLKELAEEFDVGTTTIKDVLDKKTWRHV